MRAAKHSRNRPLLGSGPGARARSAPARILARGGIPAAARIERPFVPQIAPKTCARCGRTITWRKKWAACWDEVRFCGQKCRRSRLTPVDEALEREMAALLRSRAAGATICPSEAARAVAPDWRPLMERARMAARRLVAAGVAEVTQGGRVVDPSVARGPIRVRARR